MKHIYTFLCLFLLSGVGYAGDYFNANEQGVAIDGFDPVAYFELKKAVRGSESIKQVGTVRRGTSQTRNTKKCFSLIPSDSRQSMVDGAQWQ